MINKKSLIFLFVIFLISVFAFGVFAHEEAPMLAEKVEKGELPAVEDRLPQEPFEVGPGVLVAEENLDWEAGSYGGTLREVHSTPDWDPDVFMAMCESLLAGPGFNTADIQGNVLKDFEVNEDNTVFTFYMREGLKWSDGVPVTSEDIEFTYEDMILNEQVTPQPPLKFRSGGVAEGEAMELEIIDDYTFSLTSTEPYGEFLTEITVAGWASYQELLKPKHYLKQFHADYTPVEDMQEEMAEEELEDEWWDLLTARDVPHWDITQASAQGFPVLTAWMPVEAPSGIMRFERNPYYFKVDTEGKQLPYIDRIDSYEVSDAEMVHMKVITGEVDFLRDGASAAKLPLYKAHEEDGNYNVHLFFDGELGERILFLNHTYNDPVWRELMSDIRFRQAVSMGIDRQEISESIYYGLGQTTDLIPAEYTEYNPERANQLLDELGMDERDSQGYRLGPDGEQFKIYLEQMDVQALLPQAELLAQQLSDIGLNVDLVTRSNELLGIRQESNEVMATVIWQHTGAGWRYGAFKDYLPSPGWGPLWMSWYNSGGDSGEEPPTWIKELYDIHERIMATLPTSEAGRTAVQDLYDLYYENIPTIPTVAFDVPVIISQDLRNVPHGGHPNSWNLRGPEQFFFVEK